MAADGSLSWPMFSRALQARSSRAAFPFKNYRMSGFTVVFRSVASRRTAPNTASLMLSVMFFINTACVQLCSQNNSAVRMLV